MKFKRWRPEEPVTGTFALVAPAEAAFETSNLAFFVSRCPLFADWEFLGATNMSTSVRCRFKGFEAEPDALDVSWEALGVVDASRDDGASFSTSAR